MSYDRLGRERFEPRPVRVAAAVAVGLSTYWTTMSSHSQLLGDFPNKSPDPHAAAGHVLGNHSYSHELHRCFTARLVEDEVSRAQDVFEDVLQLRPRLYRPPWLARTSATFRVLARHDLQAVSGTFCHPLEVAQPSAERIASRAVAQSTPGGMIIFHDGYNGRGAIRDHTLDAVARTVDTLAERGWSFVTVDELFDVEPYNIPRTGPCRPPVATVVARTSSAWTGA